MSLDTYVRTNMIARSAEGRCAECGEDLRGGGQVASVPGYPPKLWFSTDCLESIGRDLLSAEQRRADITARARVEAEISGFAARLSEP